MTGYQKKRLVELVHEFALRFGEFKLASGQTASFYLDCRKLTLSGEGANQVALGMLEVLDETGMPDAVGGMAIGADPITAAIVTSATTILPTRSLSMINSPAVPLPELCRWRRSSR